LLQVVSPAPDILITQLATQPACSRQYCTVSTRILSLESKYWYVGSTLRRVEC
jgi:hypothetical protein